MHNQRRSHSLHVVGVPTITTVYETRVRRPKPGPREPRELMPDDTVRRIIGKARNAFGHKLHWCRCTIVDWRYTDWGTLGCIVEDAKTGKRELWTVGFKTHEPKYLCPWP